MARISDVAKHAGVSVATVSRVLSGQTGVSSTARERVLASVKSLDYHPDLAARRLRSRRTDTLGLVVADIRNPYFTEVSRAIEDVAYARGLRILLCNSDEDPDKERFYLDMLRDENVAGVILSPTLALLEHFRPADYAFPIVLIDRCTPATQADAVVLDNQDAAHRLMQHLIERGCRRITLFHGASSATALQRLEGCREALRTVGLEAVTHAISPTPAAARTALLDSLRTDPMPDAVVASNGLILLGLAEALRESALDCPDSLALAGFDDMPWTRIMTPAITVVAQPTAEIGRTAIEQLLARINAPTLALRHVVLRGELLVRGSTQR